MWAVQIVDANRCFDPIVSAKFYYQQIGSSAYQFPFEHHFDNSVTGVDELRTIYNRFAHVWDSHPFMKSIASPSMHVELNSAPSKYYWVQ